MEAPLVADLQRILVYNHDPMARADAHFRLGQLHAVEGRNDPARRHLTEALHLDAAMQGARSLLAELVPPKKAERGFFQRMFRR
ncbi:MAG: hypothetical protein GY913_27915 [Proteobacteria bacterium]|nr:hypothetical protein [Pseudomonadota bacterium]MCP4920737.1 hypothetical protein [Pseudomonadota bacterium]